MKGWVIRKAFGKVVELNPTKEGTEELCDQNCAQFTHLPMTDTHNSMFLELSGFQCWACLVKTMRRPDLEKISK